MAFSRQSVMLFLLMVLPQYLAVTSKNRTNSKDLLQRLLDNYGAKSLRPVWDLEDSVTVRLRFLPAQLIYFNEKQQEVAVTSMMAQTWTDEFMTWDQEAEGVNSLSVALSELWMPDIALYENVDREFLRYRDFPVFIFPNGSVLWYTPMITTTTCRVRVRYFPFDTQVCNVTFGSWSHSINQVNLTFQSDGEATEFSFLQNGVWELVGMRMHRLEKSFLCCKYPFSLIVYTMYLKRSSTFYVNTILVPCILLSFMNLLVFWLPPDAGEKISLGMTNLLALILFQQLVAENMPPLGDQFPIIGTFFAIMIAVGCIAVTGTVVVLRIFYKGSDRPPPKFLRRLLKKPFLKRSLHRHTAGYSSARRHKIHSRGVLEKLEKSITLHYPNDSELVEYPENNAEGTGPEVPSPSKEPSKQTRDFRTVMQELRKSEERALDTEKREMVEQEWKDLAVVIDLLLFLILVSITLLALVVLIVSFEIHKRESTDTLADMPFS